jgi:thiol-disulfide isomerase/thioredoxin
MSVCSKKGRPSSRQHFFYSALFSLFIILSAPVAADTVDFSLPDLNGKEIKLSHFLGKWIVVNYWATWCPPCLSEIPELIDFHDTHKDKDAVVLGINFEDIDAVELKEFTQDYFMNYPILREKPAAKGVLGAISGLPTSYLISPQGEIMAVQTGPVTAKMIEDFIDGQKIDGQKKNKK